MTSKKAELAEAQPKALVKNRRQGNLWIAGLFLVALVMYRFSDDLLTLLMELEAGHRIEDEANAVPDMGMRALQPLFLKVAYLLCGTGVAALFAGFMQTRLRADSFGNYSRWAVLFIVFLLCYSLLGA